MGESYTEQLVKQKTSTQTMLKKAGLIVALVVLVIVAMVIPFLVFLPVLGIMGVWYLWKRWNCVEFEYIYYNGEIDIDRIMGREARKRVLSASAKDMEVLAPTGSDQLRPFQNLKVYDCSSNTGNKTYELVTKVKEQNARVIFEPNDEILQGMRYYAPRKVIL